MKKKVTLEDISKELDISPGTVSRALNNSPLISDEKRKLIWEKAHEMGYEKRTIKRPRSRAILNIILFLPHLEEPQSHLFYDFAALIHGIRSGFRDTKINIITELNTDPYTVLEIRKLGNIDGVIFAFTDPSTTVSTLLKNRKIPFVLLNRESDQFNYISLDNNQAMKKLFSLAKKRIPNPVPFYIGYTKAEKVNSWRSMAFLDQCKQKEITKCKMSHLSNLQEITGEFINSIRNDGFNWIVCFNDVVAVSAICAAFGSGLSIPKDLSVTGFDNSPLLNILPIKIDTIDLETEQMGKKAGEWLYGRIINKENTLIRLELPARHVEGNSLGSKE